MSEFDFLAIIISIIVRYKRLETLVNDHLLYSLQYLGLSSRDRVK